MVAERGEEEGLVERLESSEISNSLDCSRLGTVAKPVCLISF